MNAREVLRLMIRKHEGSMTVWSKPEIDAAFARYDEEHRAEILAEAKIEVVAWLVKKDRENTPVGELASKVDRGAVRIFLGTGHYRDAMDAHRAKVLAEAADYFEERRLARADTVTDFDRGRRAAEGCVVEELRELAAAGGEEATAAAATATPFFRPGRSYLVDGFEYRCRTVDTHPGKGEREAWGWLHRGGVIWRLERLYDADYTADVAHSGEASRG